MKLDVPCFAVHYEPGRAPQVVEWGESPEAPFYVLPPPVGGPAEIQGLVRIPGEPLVIAALRPKHGAAGLNMAMLMKSPEERAAIVRTCDDQVLQLSTQLRRASQEEAEALVRAWSPFDAPGVCPGAAAFLDALRPWLKPVEYEKGLRLLEGTVGSSEVRMQWWLFSMATVAARQPNHLGVHARAFQLTALAGPPDWLRFDPAWCQALAAVARGDYRHALERALADVADVLARGDVRGAGRALGLYGVKQLRETVRSRLEAPDLVELIVSMPVAPRASADPAPPEGPNPLATLWLLAANQGRLSVVQVRPPAAGALSSAEADRVARVLMDHGRRALLANNPDNKLLPELLPDLHTASVEALRAASRAAISTPWGNTVIATPLTLLAQGQSDEAVTFAWSSGWWKNTAVEPALSDPEALS